MRFNERLSELLKEKDTNQKTLAEHLGISRQAVSQYVQGETQPSIEISASIANFFGVSIDYLAGVSELRTFDLFSVDILKNKIKNELIAEFAEWIKQ